MSDSSRNNKNLSSGQDNSDLNRSEIAANGTESVEEYRARVRASMAKLQRNILKSFPKKKFIGDIPITDEEFKLLIFYLRMRYNKMRSSGNHICNDQVLCVALVQIGMRYYDGKYWPHVKRLLNDPSFGSNQQGWLGYSFVATMKKNDKLQISFSDRVDAILMHCFVADQYANRFFEYLYTFYTIDLDRDISRLDRETMNSLIEIIKKNDNTGRTYFLVEHTADAVRQNERGAKTRIRYYLKLIDKAFWGDPLPERSKNRLVQRFMEWKNSAVFIQEREGYISSGKKGRKSFSTPYIKFNGKSGTFSLIIPEQILVFREFTDVCWTVESEHLGTEIPINPYLMQGVTGYKTEAVTLPLSEESLFDAFSINLMDGSERLKKFRIVEDLIRFFDEDGFFIRDDALPEGTVYSFTEPGLYPKSEALIESVDGGAYVLSTFDFVIGDIVIVPGGKPISVGGTLKEGMLPRGKVEGVIAREAEKARPIYKAVPQLLIRMQPQRAAGTALSVNGKIYRFSSEENGGISEFELFDRSGEKGYLVDLSAFGCRMDGEYSVVVNVPNDRTIRQWKFVLIRFLEFEFEEAPYIFKTRGTLKLPFNSRFKAKGEIREEVTDFKRFNFDIIPGESRLYLDYQGIDVGFAIPTFSYKFHGEDWMIEPHVDIWHGDFEPRLSIAYDADWIRFFLEDVGEEDTEDQSETFRIVRNKGIFECDLNRFKSWFGRESVMRRIFMQLPGVRGAVPFVKVITRSVFVSGLIRADYKNNRMIGECDVIGYSDYYVDVVFDRQKIFEKIKLKDNCFEVETELRTGMYTVIVYEAEEDESGFGDTAYYEIGRFNSSLLNPADLSGMCIEVTRIHPQKDTVSYLQLDYTYQIVDLVNDPEQNHTYSGKMIVSGRQGVVATFQARVEFFDTDKLQQVYVTFADEEDSCEFLYDEYLRSIVKKENSALTKSEAYRRYNISLFPEDYVFDVKFIERPKNAGIEVNDEDYNNLRIKVNYLKKIMSESIFEKKTKQSPKQDLKPRRGGLSWRSHQ